MPLVISLSPSETVLLFHPNISSACLEFPCKNVRVISAINNLFSAPDKPLDIFLNVLMRFLFNFIAVLTVWWTYYKILISLCLALACFWYFNKCQIPYLVKCLILACCGLIALMLIIEQTTHISLTNTRQSFDSGIKSGALAGMLRGWLLVMSSSVVTTKPEFRCCVTQEHGEELAL